MSELAILVIVLLAISLAIFTVTHLINQHRAGVASRIARSRWQIEEHVTNGYWRIETVRPGERNQEGQVRCDDPDFDSKVEEARINAELRLHTLNRALPR
jgi:hypothetical protein